MVAGKLDGCLARRMEQCILNGSVQGKAKPQPVRSLASSPVAGRIKSLIFKPFKPPTQKSRMHRTQNTTVQFIPWNDQNAMSVDVENLIACAFCKPPLWNQANINQHNDMPYGYCGQKLHLK
jgi:hypothetical protein